MLVLSALAFTILGCACLYLASPNQKWFERESSNRLLLAAACLLLAAGLASWVAALRPLSGLFVMLHVAMVCLFAFPYAVALRRARRS
ncbi:hypothetical protein CAL29_24320 [Bordetella genomosp. 10]|uniref:Uncharacterized protein n=1 Tax=Bordetella genomosp. 10 TaxID=1416804 RepID=A0A261S257_9BORD|nr:hypothetical protein [Bordetella genomosp. 10]OZI31067.1 hypothetical protein CAL29_24320 [Bordetella genomosp. 10]